VIQFRNNPALADNTVDELLRYLTIFQFGVPRTPLEDVELEGCLIKAGESLTLSLPAANRDPAQFDSANQLDITRSARGHLAFGFGIHFCLGRNLAHIEMQTGYTELFREFPTLRLAVPSEEVALNTDAGFYGIHRLPVAW
jgi:cytochrome P450